MSTPFSRQLNMHIKLPGRQCPDPDPKHSSRVFSVESFKGGCGHGDMTYSVLHYDQKHEREVPFSKRLLFDVILINAVTFPNSVLQH